MSALYREYPFDVTFVMRFLYSYLLVGFNSDPVSAADLSLLPLTPRVLRTPALVRPSARRTTAQAGTGTERMQQAKAAKA